MFNAINLFDSDSDEEIRERIQRMRAPKRIRARVNYLNELNESEFIRRFRLSKATFQTLLNQIQEQIKPATNRNNSIDSRTKLLLCLRFYATGSMLLVVGDFLGVSESAACVIIRDVTEVISNLRPVYVKLPTTAEEIMNIQLKFYRIARFPKVIGAIDCTHVEIESPGGPDAEYYRNRKGWFSWNVQTVCDSDLRIRDIVARWPGSTHDQTIFNNSALKRKLSEGIFGDALIVGDSGYGVTSYLMTPLANPSLPEEVLYNESQIRTRNCVERSYGVWKRRFPILSLCMRVSLQNSQNIIIASAVLHNMAIDANNELPQEDPEIIAIIRDNENRRLLEVPEPHRNQLNNERRLSLIRDYFRNLL